MEIEITSTEKLTAIDGVPVRLWEGVTDGGQPCLVFVHRVAVADGVDAAEFERELAEQPQPGRVFPLSLIL